MAAASRSAKLFLERAGLVPTLRGPLPSHDAESSAVHGLTLQSPLPLPEFQKVLRGDPSPDRGATQEWPNGPVEE